MLNIKKNSLSKLSQRAALVVILMLFTLVGTAQTFNTLNYKSSQMEELVGIWSRDLAESKQSVVMEFKRNGNVEIVLYDRNNIQNYSIAYGKYLIKESKLYTVFYETHGNKNYFKLNEVVESDLVTVNTNQLTIKTANKSEMTYKIMSRVSLKKNDTI